MKEDTNVIGKDFNTLSISWMMFCFQESKMINLLLVERATFKKYNKVDNKLRRTGDHY